MRRIVVAVAAAAVIALANAGVIAASNDVAISVTDTSLVARGAGVDVTFDVVCNGNQDSTAFNLEYGSVRVDQAAGKKLMAHAESQIYGQTLTCDGSTVNALVVRLVPESVPFRKGDAIVGIHLYLTESLYWTSEYGDASAVVRLG